MTNKFIAILLIVMVCVADASPLLKQWSYRQQRLKSGQESKTGLQSKTYDIQLKRAPGGGRVHGRKLSVSDPIETVVSNLVGGTAQANIECKALDNALKAGHQVAPNIFYHADLVEFAQTWRDVYNVDITAAVCIGKLHALEITGEQNSVPAVCVGFNKLSTDVCPTYATKWCAEYRTIVDGVNDAAILAAEVIDTDDNEQYEDLYSQRLIEGGGSESTFRKYYATHKPTSGGKIAGGCPGLSLGLRYDTTSPDSIDSGQLYVNQGREPMIFERDNDYYLPNGRVNTNVGLPKIYDNTYNADGDIIGCVSGSEAIYSWYDYDYEEAPDGGDNVIGAIETVPMTDPDDDVDGNSYIESYVTRRGCANLLNKGSSANAGVAHSGVQWDGLPVTSTTGKVAHDVLADIDTCPGLGRPRQSSTGASSTVPSCEMSDFANLISSAITNDQGDIIGYEEGINEVSGSCIRRIYTDLCTSRTNASAHDHQIAGSDASGTPAEASFTKPLVITLAAGDYCDGDTPTLLGACALKRRLEQDFSFKVSCEALAFQMTHTGSYSYTESVRNVAVDWQITSPSSTTLLGEYADGETLKELRADFHCADELSTTGLCASGTIPVSHACHGLIRRECAKPDYKTDGIGQPYHTSTGTTTINEAGQSVTVQDPCEPSLEKKIEAWRKATGLEGTFRSEVPEIAEIYSDTACNGLKKEVDLDGAEQIFQKCASLEADLANIRITYATEYLLHDAQAKKKDKFINFEKHVNAYKASLSTTCETEFGTVNALTDTEIKALKPHHNCHDWDCTTEEYNQYVGGVTYSADFVDIAGEAATSIATDGVLGLQDLMIRAATTPEDVAINQQRTKLDTRIRELEESIALIKEAHDNAVLVGVDVTAAIVKFEKIVKSVLVRLVDTYNSTALAGLAPMDSQAACPHLAGELAKLADEDYQHTDVANWAASDDSSLTIELNSGATTYVTNLVTILETTIGLVNATNQAGTDTSRTVDLKKGLQELVIETAEYCLWESQDRYDRCETCAAREQLYADKNILNQVQEFLTIKQGFEQEKLTVEATSCLEPVYETPFCPDAQADLDAGGCHTRSELTDYYAVGEHDYGRDINDGYCDDPNSPQYDGTNIHMTPTGPTVCSDICDCGNAANLFVATGDAGGNPLSRHRHRLSRKKLKSVVDPYENATTSRTHPISSTNQVAGGVGNKARRDACSIGEQGILARLFGINAAAEYIKGYPSTGYDDPLTEDVVETTESHAHYNSASGVANSDGTILYDKTTFTNHLAACTEDLGYADTRGCPAATSGTSAQTNLVLSSGTKSALEAKAIGETSDFEVKRAQCISALDIVLVDTALAYDCAISQPSNSFCKDGALTQFIKQCEKTDGSVYVAHESPYHRARDIGVNGPSIYQAVRDYARSEDAYDAAKNKRIERENELNIDPSELKNLKDDVKSAQTYKNVIEKHIQSLEEELAAFNGRHATVKVKCQNLIEAKVRAKVEHALELKKYDFEVDELDQKKQEVNSKTYDGAKDALDDYCEQVSQVKDAISISSLSDINNIVRSGERCNTYDAEPECCQPDSRTGNELISTHDDYIEDPRSADCVTAEAALDAARLCVDVSGDYNGHSTKADCIAAITTGTGVDGECVLKLPLDSDCTHNAQCTSGVCDYINVNGTSTSKQVCLLSSFAASGENCTTDSAWSAMQTSGITDADGVWLRAATAADKIYCMPYGSVRTVAGHVVENVGGVPQPHNIATGQWTQVCNTAGKCSDYNMGLLNEVCASTASQFGNGDTCDEGFTCDLDGPEGSSEREARLRGDDYDATYDGKDICITNTLCTDGIHNGLESGIDCGPNSGCRHTAHCVAGTAIGHAIDAECTFHSDCSRGAACTQQYVYEDVFGDSCTQGTHGCNQVAVEGAAGHLCQDPYCDASTPVVNPLFNQIIQCADEDDLVDPYGHTETLNTFTVNGITFKYFVVTATETAEELAQREADCIADGYTWDSDHEECSHGTGEHTHGSYTHTHRRRLLSRNTYDFNKYGRQFRSARMPNQNARAEWLQRTKHQALQSHKLMAASDLDVCQNNYDSRGANDQQEFSTQRCLVDSDCELSEEATGIDWDLNSDTYNTAIGQGYDNYVQGTCTPNVGPVVTIGGTTVQYGLCEQGNSAYSRSASDTPDCLGRGTHCTNNVVDGGDDGIDVLNICDSDGDSTNGYSHSAGQYASGVLDKFGFSVGDNLRLASGYHRQHNQHDQRMFSHRHRNRKLREANHKYHLEGFNNKLRDIYDPTPGFLLPQADNLRDCKHENKNFCSFSMSVHADVEGFCSTDCSDCFTGQCTDCATTTVCAMENVVQAVAGEVYCKVPHLVKPSELTGGCTEVCVAKYFEIYDTAQECIDAGNMASLCTITHPCATSPVTVGSAGNRVDPNCLNPGETGYHANGTVYYTGNGPVRLVDPDCDESTCEIKTAQPTHWYDSSVILGNCQVPANAATCQSQGTCAVGVSCAADTECASPLICESNVCAVFTEAACSYTTTGGKSIDEMNVTEIKEAFINGTTIDDIGIDYVEEVKAIGEEQVCTCNKVIGATQKAANDAAVVQEMQNRIDKLTKLIQQPVNVDSEGKCVAVGCKLKGQAVEAVEKAEAALTAYLTNTASGAADISTLTSEEETAKTARDTARAAALQVAAPAYLDYYKNVVNETEFSTMESREEAYTLYAHLEQGAPACLSDGSNAVACQALTGDVDGQDDTYLDELHRIFAACQGASYEAHSMKIANENAGLYRQEALDAAIVDGAGNALNITKCVEMSKDEFDIKKEYDDLVAKIADEDAKILAKGYVPAGDIVKQHKHYSCCTDSLEALQNLERCATNSDCSGGGGCIGHFCVQAPCLCATGYNTYDGTSTKTDDFPIDDADCNITTFDPFCGDGVCDVDVLVGGVNYNELADGTNACESDCRCGDGTCESGYQGQFGEGGEDCVNCPADCGSESTYVLNDVTTECPIDIHNDTICGCYPDSSGLNCETVASAPLDCTCERLCNNYDEDNLYTQSRLTDKTTHSAQCATVSDCTDLDEEARITAANEVAFCLALDARFEVGISDGSGAVLWGQVLTCGKAATGLEAEVTCPEMAYNTQRVAAGLSAIVPGGALERSFRCGPAAAIYIASCMSQLDDEGNSYVPEAITFPTGMSLRAKTGEFEFGDHTSASAGDPREYISSDFQDQAGTGSTTAGRTGMVANCESISHFTGIRSDAQKYSLSRSVSVRAAQGLDPIKACEVGVTQVDLSCVNWKHTLGCPASCGCTAPVQPVYNHTGAVFRGDIIEAEVPLNVCGKECLCGDAVQGGMQADVNGSLYATSCFNTCADPTPTGPVCADASTDALSECHIQGSSTPGGDINDGWCDDPIAYPIVEGHEFYQDGQNPRSAYAFNINGGLHGGVCSDICDCGNADNNWTATGNGKGNPLSRHRHTHQLHKGRHGRHLHDECTGVETGADEDCSAIQQGQTQSLSEYEALVGACYLRNSLREHQFYCLTNNGREGTVPGCNATDYKHAVIASDLNENKCYGKNNYTAGVVDTDDFRAPGCRTPLEYEADGLTLTSGSDQLTGGNCFYTDGTYSETELQSICFEGDKIARANSVILPVPINIAATDTSAATTAAGAGHYQNHPDILDSDTCVYASAATDYDTAGDYCGKRVGGNRECDVGETVANCPSDCKCGDGICGTNANMEDESDSTSTAFCDSDCVYSCLDHTSGGCYNFEVASFRTNKGIGQWSEANGHDGSFDSFKTYCGSWEGNSGVTDATTVAKYGSCPTGASTCADAESDAASACHQRRGGADVNDGYCDDPLTPSAVRIHTGIANYQEVCEDKCDCGHAGNDWEATGDGSGSTYRRLGSTPSKKKRRKLLGFESLKQWAKTNMAGVEQKFKSLVDKVSRRRKLLAYDFKPSDRNGGSSVPWLELGSTTFNDQEALCLGSQKTAIDTAILSAFRGALGHNGLNDVDEAKSTTAQVDDLIADVGPSSVSNSEVSINLILRGAIDALDTRLAQIEAAQGECTASEIVTVHQYAKSWVPVEHCYPLKFIEGQNIYDLSHSCTNMAHQAESYGVKNHPLPTDVDGQSSAYRESIRHGFLSLTDKFKYLSFEDEADITSQCTSKGSLLCSQASIDSRTALGSGSCMPVNSGFPARQSCLNEYKKNLADIALWLDTSVSGFSGSASETQAEIDAREVACGEASKVWHVGHSNCEQLVESFKVDNVQVLGAATENALGKFKALRQFIGDKYVVPAIVTDQYSVGTIQSCWEAYEREVGYVDELQWLIHSNALAQAIGAVHKEEIAIIQVHAQGKAECKENCNLYEERDQWSKLEAKCPVADHLPSGDGIQSTCKCRREYEDITSPVLCNCMFDRPEEVSDSTAFTSSTSMENYNGAGVEDCQVEPLDYVTGSSVVNGLALVYQGQSPTSIVTGKLLDEINYRDDAIDNYVNKLVYNLDVNLQSDGLLGQQNANTIVEACKIMNQEAGEAQALQLADENALDNFYDNYMQNIQNGTVSNATARRLATEPCSLCD